MALFVISAARVDTLLTAVTPCWAGGAQTTTGSRVRALAVRSALRATRSLGLLLVFPGSGWKSQTEKTRRREIGRRHVVKTGQRAEGWKIRHAAWRRAETGRNRVIRAEDGP